MALVIALALMTGLQQRAARPHRRRQPPRLRLEHQGIDDYHAESDKLRQVPHVIGAAPAILGQGLVSAARDTQPMMIKGIDPELEQQVTDIRSAMRERQRSTALRRQVPTTARDGILLGSDLATKLGVRVGDTVSVLTPQEMLTPNGLTLRPARLLRVAGTFSLGLYEFDSHVRLRVNRRGAAAVGQGSGRSHSAARG